MKAFRPPAEAPIPTINELLAKGVLGGLIGMVIHREYSPQTSDKPMFICLAGTWAQPLTTERPETC